MSPWRARHVLGSPQEVFFYPVEYDTWQRLSATVIAPGGALLPPNEDNTARLSALTELVTIPANGFSKLEDLVGILGEVEVAGGLYLEARASGAGLPAVLVSATTHTFTPNPSGDGVYGQGLPGVGPSGPTQARSIRRAETRSTTRDSNHRSGGMRAHGASC